MQKNKIISPRRIRNFFQRSKNLPLADPIEAKRNSIFNPELKDLVERVKSPQNATALNLTQDRFLNNLKSLIPPEKAQEYKLLHSLFCPEKTIQDSSIMEYTTFVLERVGVEFFSWHFLAYDSNAYFSEMSFGIDIVTRKNFLFLKTDPYIARYRKNFCELKMTPDLIKDPFFHKKFSPESLSLYSKLYFFFLDDIGVDACLVAFIEKKLTEPGEDDSETDPEIMERWLRMIEDKIQILSPALKRYRKERLQPRISKDDMLTSSLHYFKSVLGEGLDRFYVQKIKIVSIPDENNAYYWKKQFYSKLLSILGNREKMIELDVSSVIILSEENQYKNIQRFAEEDNIVIHTKQLVYPDDGENILIYL